MKAFVLIVYMLLSLIYLIAGDGSIGWGGINVITQYSIIAALAWFVIEGHRLITFERVLFKFIIAFNISLSLITIPCVWADIKWINLVIYWYSVIVSIIFVATLYYAWRRHRNELRIA